MICLCRKCGEDSAENFYVSCLTLCKKCYSARVRENRLKNIDHYREFDRRRAMLPKRVAIRIRYQKTPAGKAAVKRAKAAWIERNGLKRAAHILVGNAVRDGKLTKLPCEKCGRKQVQAHHEDYTKPLDVRWLCAKHHREEHNA